MTIQIEIAPNGRMNLPADLRERLGLVHGGAMFVEEMENGLVLRTPAQIVARAHSIAKRFAAGRTDISVDAFLASRRSDSGM